MSNAGYELLDRIAVGGTAEISLARARDSATVVVQKRLLPHLARDRESVTMLEEEARLAALLRHDNIVRVFEFGSDEETSFIAMEYLVGADLAVITRTAAKHGHTIAEAPLVAIASKVAGALHYAHNVRASDGTALDIIHRDVTPRNIVVTDQGTVKLVDFGVARARRRVARTSPGVLKGNLLFMAPEYLRGEVVDHRVDVYELGMTMLWSLLGSLPIDENHQAEVARGAPLRLPTLLELQPQANPRLSAIIARATAAPEARYASALEMQRALDDHLAVAGQSVGAAELAAMMRQLFGPEHFAAQRRRSESPSPRSPAREPEPPVAVRRPLRRGYAAAALLVALAAVAAVQLSGDPPDDSAAPAVAAVHAAPAVVPERAAAGSPSGTLTLQSDMPLRVHLRGRNLGITPFSELPLPAGAHRLQLTSAEHGIAASRIVHVEPGRAALHRVVIGKGRLTVEARPEAEVWVANRKVGTTPLDVEHWEGDYELVLINRELGVEKSWRISIDPAKPLRIVESLAHAGPQHRH